MQRVALFCVLAWGISFGQNQNTGAPFQGRQFTAEQAAAAEAAVLANPDDVSARLNLLGYYWSRAKVRGSNEVNRAARVNHLLWFIANHPESPVFTMPEGSPPDARDFEQMKQAWGQALTPHSDDARVLSNAARVYALILTAVDASPALQQSVRAELEQCRQARVLYAAGSALGSLIAERQGLGPNMAELQELSSRLMDRAKALEPGVMPQRIRVGGNVQAANLVRKVDPVYPQLAKEARIQGVVRFAVAIAKDGTVQNVQLVSGHPLLVASAVEVVKQWVYKPTLLNGLPVEVLTQVDVNFSLQP